MYIYIYIYIYIIHENLPRKTIVRVSHLRRGESQCQETLLVPYVYETTKIFLRKECVETEVKTSNTFC